MPTGTIKFFNSARGFGFITTDEDPDLDIFVHMDDVDGLDFPEELQRVEFDIEDAPKGPRATNVKRLSDAK